MTILQIFDCLVVHTTKKEKKKNSSHETSQTSAQSLFGSKRILASHLYLDFFRKIAAKRLFVVILVVYYD